MMPLNYWNDRPKSKLVKILIRESGLTTIDIADQLGLKKGTVYNKMNQDRWSADDIFMIAKICGYRIDFVSEYGNDTISAEFE